MQKGLAIANDVAILYKTKVVELSKYTLKFRHGGYITRSTCKAINTTLDQWGFNGWSVNIKQGEMYLNIPDRKPSHIPSDCNFYEVCLPVKRVFEV
jgi:hypothetical protein